MVNFLWLCLELLALLLQGAVLIMLIMLVVVGILILVYEVGLQDIGEK